MEDTNDDLGTDAANAAEEKAFKELMGMTIQDILRDGQKTLFARLVGKVRAGTASHQQEAILRNILKDNGMIFLGIPSVTGESAGEEVEQHPLPHFEDPDYEERPSRH